MTARKLLSASVFTALLALAAGSASAIIAPGVDEAALIGIHGVELMPGSGVTGDVVVNEAGGTLEVASNAVAHDDVIGDSIALAPNALVGGDASFNTLDAHKKATIGGAQITPLALPVFDPLPPFLTGAGTGADVTVAPGATTPLGPGDYGHVVVGEAGVLELAGGEYSFASVAVEDGGRIEIAGSLAAAIAGGFQLGSGGYVGPAAGAAIDASDIVFYVAGADSPQEAARLLDETEIAASFYVPDGSLRIGPDATASGGFIAGSIQIFPNTVVTLDTFFVNRPPVANDQSVTTNSNIEIPIVLTGNDPDGDPLTFTIVTPPANGTLGTVTPIDATSASVLYTPNPDYVGPDAFTFQVDDGNGGTDTATVSITVQVINLAPVASPDAISVTSPGGTATTLAGGSTSLLANDSDENGDALVATTTPVSGPASGALTLNADGTFVYTHDGSATTDDGFVYEVCDTGTPVLCDAAPVSIAIGQLTTDVTVTKTGQGRIQSSPTGIDCGPTCSASFTTTFPIALIATPDPGWEFSGFGGDIDCFDGTLDPPGAKSCTATFVEEQEPVGDVTVTITQSGSGSGHVGSDPAGIDCGADCEGTYPVTTRVDLVATAAPGSRFAGWGGHGDCLDGRLDLLGNRSCTAVFELLPAQATLTIERVGTGSGSVASSPTGIFCPDLCVADFDLGQSVFLSARPEPGSAFVSWGGDCGGVAFGTDVILDSDKTCTVEFTE